MKPLDIAFQLFGDFTHAKQIKPAIWQFDGCAKFPEKHCIIRLDQGLVEIFGTVDDMVPEQAFAVEATLQPLDADFIAEQWPKEIAYLNEDGTVSFFACPKKYVAITPRL